MHLLFNSMTRWLSGRSSVATRGYSQMFWGMIYQIEMHYLFANINNLYREKVLVQSFVIFLYTAYTLYSCVCFTHNLKEC